MRIPSNKDSERSNIVPLRQQADYFACPSQQFQNTYEHNLYQPSQTPTPDAAVLQQNATLSNSSRLQWSPSPTPSQSSSTIFVAGSHTLESSLEAATGPDVIQKFLSSRTSTTDSSFDSYFSDWDGPSTSWPGASLLLSDDSFVDPPVITPSEETQLDYYNNDVTTRPDMSFDFGPEYLSTALNQETTTNDPVFENTPSTHWDNYFTVEYKERELPLPPATHHDIEEDEDTESSDESARRRTHKYAHDDGEEDYQPTKRRKTLRKSTALVKPRPRNRKPGNETSGKQNARSRSEVMHEDDAASKEPNKTIVMNSKKKKDSFPCIFGFAGCRSRLDSKNEFKRHILSLHLQLSYWVCASCPVHVDVPKKAFFRKDLFREHFKRTHCSTWSKATPYVDPELLDYAQAQAVHVRCNPPTYLRCSMGCGKEFHGERAYDKLLEHLAVYVERKQLIQHAHQLDSTLLNWAEEFDVLKRTKTGWKLSKPEIPGVYSRSYKGGWK